MNKGRVLLAVTDIDPQPWIQQLSARRDVVLEPDGPEDPSIHYAVVWKQPPDLLTRLPNLKAIFSMGAGVDHILSDRSVPEVPIIKVVADNLSQHMSEYILWRVMDHHRQGFRYRAQQHRSIWLEAPQTVASGLSIGIMGLGSLGRAAASLLLHTGFQVNGWSRNPRQMQQVRTWHGDAGLSPFLNATDVLVVLLPLTPDTRGIINYRLLGQLRGRDGSGSAALINAGRGQLQKDDDILRALDDGTLAEASLDVFEVEPLPESSALWRHPRVFVTPHAAASTDPHHLAPAMVAQMDACDRGEPLQNVIDRAAGY